MQPLNISVSIELTVSEQLKSLLSGIFQGRKALPETPVRKQKETAAEARAVEAPAPVVTAPAETVAEVSDEVLRQAVREAKTRVGVPEIRAVFKQFGIEASRSARITRAISGKAMDVLPGGGKTGGGGAVKGHRLHQGGHHRPRLRGELPEGAARIGRTDAARRA